MALEDRLLLSVPVSEALFFFCVAGGGGFTSSSMLSFRGGWYKGGLLLSTEKIDILLIINTDKTSICNQKYTAKPCYNAP